MTPALAAPCSHATEWAQLASRKLRPGSERTLEIHAAHTIGADRPTPEEGCRRLGRTGCEQGPCMPMLEEVIDVIVHVANFDKLS